MANTVPSPELPPLTVRGSVQRHQKALVQPELLRTGFQPVLDLLPPLLHCPFVKDVEFDGAVATEAVAIEKVERLGLIRQFQVPSARRLHRLEIGGK